MRIRFRPCTTSAFHAAAFPQTIEAYARACSLGSPEGREGAPEAVQPARPNAAASTSREILLTRPASEIRGRALSLVVVPEHGERRSDRGPSPPAKERCYAMSLR